VTGCRELALRNAVTGAPSRGRGIGQTSQACGAGCEGDQERVGSLFSEPAPLCGSADGVARLGVAKAAELSRRRSTCVTTQRRRKTAVHSHKVPVFPLVAPGTSHKLPRFSRVKPLLRDP